MASGKRWQSDNDEDSKSDDDEDGKSDDDDEDDKSDDDDEDDNSDDDDEDDKSDGVDGGGDDDTMILLHMSRQHGNLSGTNTPTWCCCMARLLLLLRCCCTLCSSVVMVSSAVRGEVDGFARAFVWVDGGSMIRWLDGLTIWLLTDVRCCRCLRTLVGVVATLSVAY